jgi:predicted nucleic acid-binding protein
MIILDTSFLISYYNTKDENHIKSLEIMKQLVENKEEIAITDYIFNEFVTIMFYRLKDINGVEEICNKTKELISYRVDEEIFNQSWEIFINQKNTSLSFTDTSIIATIIKNNLTGVATFDLVVIP